MNNTFNKCLYVLITSYKPLYLQAIVMKGYPLNFSDFVLSECARLNLSWTSILSEIV